MGIILEATSRLFEYAPSTVLLYSEVGGNRVEVYYQILARVIPFFNERQLSKKVSALIYAMFMALGTQAQGLDQLNDFICFLISHVEAYVSDLSLNNDFEARLLPTDIINGCPVVYQSTYDIVMVSLSTLRCLFALLKTSEQFTCTISRSGFRALVLCMLSILEYVRLKSKGFFDHRDCHGLFLEVCSTGLALDVNKLDWFDLGSRWMALYHRHFYQISSDSDFSRVICNLILDLSLFILCSDKLTSPFLETLHNFVMSERDTQYYTKNISLALTYMKKAFCPDVEVDYKDAFTDESLEAKRLSHYQYYVKPLDYEPSNIQRIIRSMFLHSAPTAGTMLELVGHFVMYFEEETLEAKIRLVKQVGELACFMSGHLTTPSLKCSNCDRLYTDISENRQEMEGFETIFTKVIECDDFSDMTLCMELVATMKRVFTSFQPEIKFDDSTTLGAWIMENIRGNSKPLRLSTSQLLPCFIKSRDGVQNTENVFEFLGNIDFDTEPHLVETTITSWCQVARVCDGERLNVVLMKLIRALGSPNSFCCSLVFHSLQNLSKSRGTNCWKMCSPFWSTISLEIVKHLDNGSSLLKIFCDLLDVSPKEFLLRTMQFTIPYLVCSRRYSIIERISKVSELPLSRIFVDNQSVVLAVLLVKVQEVVEGDMELGTIIQLVQHRLQESGLINTETTFSQIAAPNVVKSSFEILKLYSPDTGRFSRITRALTCLGSVKFNSANEAKVLKQLFSPNNVLQIVTLSSNTVRNVLGRMSYTTKLQCLYGLSMLIQSAPENFKSAVPQICAFLQSALETELLQCAALDAWAAMIEYLDGRNLSMVVGLTFSVIMQKWNSLNPNAQQKGKLIIRKIVFENLEIHSNADLYRGFPLLTTIEGLGTEIIEASRNVQHMTTNPMQQLDKLVERCTNENIYVVRQTLMELKGLLSERPELITENWHANFELDRISNLMYTLLNIPFRFHNSDMDIEVLCMDCIGMVGALDPHKADRCPQDGRLVLVHNFEQAQESKDFVFNLLERFLVKAFISSTDPDSQMYLAYGIQEFLKFCGVNVENKDGMWEKFSLDTRCTIQPLLSSKYTVRDSTPFECSYPIFTPGKKLSYNEWLMTFSLNLLRRAKGTNAEKVFGISLGTLRNLDQQYLSVFNFLLPYAALSVIVAEGYSKNESKLRRKIIGHDILLEIFSILNTPLSHDERLAPFHQTIFSLIDYLTKWMRERNKLIFTKERRNSKKPHQKDSAVVIVETFLNQISSEVLATRSFECKSFPRAIMYWENHYNIRGSFPNPTDIYSKFEYMYASLDDTDSLDGISTLFPKFDINQQILYYESTGRWDYALECYEATVNNLGKWDLDSQCKVMRCLKKAGRYEDLLGRLNEYVSDTDSEITEEWKELGIEASWLLGNWDSLRKWVTTTAADSFEVHIGNALLSLVENDKAKLEHYLVRARQNISGVISSNSVASFTQRSDQLVKLHALTDLECIGRMSFGDEQTVRRGDITQYLDDRLSLIGSDYGARRYLLALRRSAVSVSKLPRAKHDAAMAWLYIAQDAVKLGQLGPALQASMRSSELECVLGRVENAKILYRQGEQRKAVAMLEEILGGELLYRLETMGEGDVAVKQENEEAAISSEQAEIALLYTEWLDNSGEDGSEAILKRYRALTGMHPIWEKAHYRLAKYYNKLCDSQHLVEDSFQSENL